MPVLLFNNAVGNLIILSNKSEAFLGIMGAKYGVPKDFNPSKCVISQANANICPNKPNKPADKIKSIE